MIVFPGDRSHLAVEWQRAPKLPVLRRHGTADSILSRKLKESRKRFLTHDRELLQTEIIRPVMANKKKQTRIFEEVIPGDCMGNHRPKTFFHRGS